MTLDQINADYYRLLFRDEQFRRLVAVCERENARRERERAIHRDLMLSLRPAEVPVLGESLSDMSRAIIAVLADGRSHTLEEIEGATKFDRQAIRTRLKLLAQSGRVQNVSYGHWQLRPRRIFRRGESVAACLSVLNGHPVKSAEVSRCTGLSRANTFRVLRELGRRGLAVKTSRGWQRAITKTI